jgi:hypothetical protein
MSFGSGDERTALNVHATLCAVVTTQAATHEAWAEYAAVLLDAETAAFFAARLSDVKSMEGPPSKKHKLHTDGATAEAVATPEVVCDHCGGSVPEVSLRVACMDGCTLDVTVPQRGLLRDVKRLVGQVRLFLTHPCTNSHCPRFSHCSCVTWIRV